MFNDGLYLQNGSHKGNKVTINCKKIVKYALLPTFILQLFKLRQ